jgi:GNAT superfamily N-acetyltransferase
MQSEDTLEFPRYRSQMRDEILGLLGNKKHRRLTWDWQFGASPFDRQWTPIIATNREQVIGFNGVMPIDVMYAGVVIPAIWSCDFFVHPAYRGRGVGSRMKELLISRNRLILSLGISDLASPVLVKMGWVQSREVRVFAKVMTTESLGDVALKGGQWIRRIGHSVTGSHQVRYELASRLPSPAEIDKLWARVAASYGKAVCRTGSYMHWRYGMHPLAQYRFLTLTEHGQLAGIAVVRESGSSLRLVDYVGELDRAAVLGDMIAALEQFFPGAHRILCTASHRAVQAALLGSGFLRIRARPRFYVRSVPSEDHQGETGWFIMSGDSDGDLLDAARTAVSQGKPPTKDSGLSSPK